MTYDLLHISFQRTFDHALSSNSANISLMSEVTLACRDTCKNFLVSAVCILAVAVNGGRKNNERMLSAPPCHGSSIIS